MGKYTISMAIFNSYVKLPEGMRKPWKTCKLFLFKWRFQVFNGTHHLSPQVVYLTGEMPKAKAAEGATV